MARAFQLIFALCALAITVHSPTARAGEPVDALLVLAADVSRSIDQPKFQLQREGYAAAISHPQVLKAITSGLHRRIAVCFVEWSGIGAQKVVIDWTLIGDSGAARRFSDQLLEAPRSFADRTSISAAIDFAATLFGRAPYDSTRRTIDVSGDGNNNSGRDVSAARDDALAQGITINGLVILTPPDMPLAWNAEHTNPPGDFVHVGAAQPKGVDNVRSIGHQSTQLHKLLAHGDQGQPEFCGEVHNAFSLSEKHRAGKYHKGINSLIRNRGKRLIQFVRPTHSNQSKLQAQGLRCPFCFTHHVVHRARAISAGMPEGRDSKTRGKRFLEQS
jgi:Protein of unknown function (DUF1194)